MQKNITYQEFSGALQNALNELTTACESIFNDKQSERNDTIDNELTDRLLKTSINLCRTHSEFVVGILESMSVIQEYAHKEFSPDHIKECFSKVNVNTSILQDAAELLTDERVKAFEGLEHDFSKTAQDAQNLYAALNAE